MLNVSFSSHPLAKDIDRARHHQFMKEALPHLIGGMLTAGLVYFIYRNLAIEGAAWFWLVGNAILLMCTAVFYSIYYFKPTIISVSQWGAVTFIVSMLWGLCWAMPPHIFLATDSFLYIAVLIVILVALATSPAPAMVHYPSAYYVFITLPLASLTAKVATLDLGGDVVMLVLTPFLWVSLIAYGWGLHGTMINSIKLRLENEQAWREAEKANLAKSQFLAAASHDIRQPLQAINLFLNSLRNRNREPQDELLFERLDASVESMSELLNSLLDVSKLDAQAVEVRPRHIALQPLCEKLSHELGDQAQAKSLQLNILCSDAVVYADAVLLERVLNNLLSNALRYTQTGFVSLSAYRAGSEVIIEVKDSGIGIADAEQEAIFSEFHQVDNPERDKQKGLGLGLAIVRRLCDLQSWKLSLDSELGKGSCFSVYLPLGVAAEVEPPKTNNPSVNLQSVSVLVIDDEESIQQGLKSLLESWGCRVVAFGSLQSALKNISTVGEIDLIISDYRLRAGENGIDAIRELKQSLGADIESLLITGDTAPDRIQEARDSGLTVFHKPVKPAQLRSAIQRKLKHLL